jgi:hypothetical protein
MPPSPYSASAGGQIDLHGYLESLDHAALVELLADRTLDYGDGVQVGMGPELHVEGLDRYQVAGADVVPAWPCGGSAQ